MFDLKDLFDEEIVVTRKGIVPLRETERKTADGYRKGSTLYLPLAGKKGNPDMSYDFVFGEIVDGSVTGIYIPHKDGLYKLSDSKIEALKDLGYKFYLPKKVYLTQGKLGALGMSADAIIEAMKDDFIPHGMVPVPEKTKHPRKRKDTRTLDEKHPVKEKYDRSSARNFAKMEIDQETKRYPAESLEDGNRMYE